MTVRPVARPASDEGSTDRLAADALALATVRPAEAEVLAAQAERAARARTDWATVSTALRARGVAAMQLRQVEPAVRHLRAAVQAAGRVGDPRLRGEARMSLAAALVMRGDAAQARRCIQRAVSELDGLAAARARTQRSAMLYELGRLDEALEDLRLALPVLRRHSDAQWQARALSNRSLVHSKRRHFAAAESDLVHAKRLCEEHGLTLAGAYVEQNLGCVCAGRGDVPAALEHFDAAHARYQELGLQVGSLLLDRATVLLSVRLVDEARANAEAAVAVFAAQKRGLNLPEAQLLLSTAALLQDDLVTAASAAAAASRTFARLGRQEWLALARYAELQAEVAATGPAGASTSRPAVVTSRPVSARRARARAVELERAGWTVPALEARVLAGRLALDQGRPLAARADLRQAARARHNGPAEARARAWLAEAMLRQQSGRRPGARSALRTGIRVLEDHQATLGATELRAHVSVHRGALARTGLRMALEDGDPASSLWWAERGRAGAGLLRPVRPPDDPAMAFSLQDLRATMSEIDLARGQGASSAALVARQIELEQRIRDQSRRSPGCGGSAATLHPSGDDLARALGPAALVEYVEQDELLHAVTLVEGRARLHTLGPSGPVRYGLRHLPFALHRLANPETVVAQVDAAYEVVRRTSSMLQTVLLDPLAGSVADRPLVLVPAGWLQSLPWSLLPCCAGRPVTVAPSAAVWHTAHARTPPADGGVVAIAGPGLPGAVAEVRAVATMHHGAAVLSGHAATSHRVAAALDGARLAHVAAHGTVRADNPLFSSLALEDGPFTVYDLERLTATPHHMVLAACDTARSHITAGEELLGLAAALLSQHTATLVAPVVPVPDAATAPFMVAYHALLLAGREPADALARAQERHADGDRCERVAAASFICLGTGGP